MKFKSGTRRKANEYEKALVKYWKENKTFEKSVENRPLGNAYVFYDGPPFITGVPHHGTLLSSIVKDAMPRYQTMKGKRVERVWGWDCHGLPAETFTEKKLGIKGKQEVIDYGLENYILACRENMVTTGDLWESTIDRIGRWVDFKGAYKPWTTSTWNPYGGHSKNYTTWARFTRAKKFLCTVPRTQRRYQKLKSPWTQELIKM